MAITPILVVGGTALADPGETVTGAATNNTETDSYIAYGYNNIIIENGGNLIVNPVPVPADPNFGLTPNLYTTIELGHATAVTDKILLYGYHNTIETKHGAALSGGSTVDVTIEEGFGGYDTIDLVNNGGTNSINLDYQQDETVTLVGAVNFVNAAEFSIIKINGNANNIVSTDRSEITIGSKNDGFFGYLTNMYLGGGCTVTAGDENVTVSSFSDGNIITLGNGTNDVLLVPLGNLSDGMYSTIKVGGGDNTILAGAGNDQVLILGRQGETGRNVPDHPTDTVTLAGSNNTVTATYENVTITGTTATASTVTLGNGDNSVTLGGTANVVTVGSGTNTIVVGTSTDVTLVGGHDTVTAGAQSIVHVNGGVDTIGVGSNATVDIAGTHSSRSTITLANDNVVSATGGKEFVSGGTNATLFFDDSERGTTVTFSDKDDQLYLGSSASAMVFLNPGGGDLVSVQALDATGSYSGVVAISNFLATDVLYLRGLQGGIVHEALSSFAAVQANLTSSHGNEVLHLLGGGKIVFEGTSMLPSSAISFLNTYGPVVSPSS